MYRGLSLSACQPARLLSNVCARVESSRVEVVRTAATTSHQAGIICRRSRDARRGAERSGVERSGVPLAAAWLRQNRTVAPPLPSCTALISDKQRVTRYQLHRKTEFTKLAAVPTRRSSRISTWIMLRLPRARKIQGDDECRLGSFHRCSLTFIVVAL